MTDPTSSPVIDSHLHLWDIEQGSYPWLTPEAGGIYRTFAVADAEPELAAANVDHAVLVQAADSYEDTAAMLAIVDAWPRAAAVVGWVPLTRPTEAAPVLEQYAADPRVVGIRHLIHDDPDPDWLLRDDVARGLDLVQAAGLAYDVVAVLPRHLEHVPVLARRYPALPLVIDHLAKPPIAAKAWEPWADLITAAAAYPNVSAKVSGLDTAADPATYTAADLRPYLDHALGCFGPERLMFGSDWPVSTLAGGYARWWEVLGELLQQLSPSERGDILGGTALRTYGIALATVGKVAP